MSGFYLSESALKNLEFNTPEFSKPKINPSATANEKASCGSPRRMMVPDVSTNIPFPPIEINKNRLERWLRDHFRLSAFNTCPR